MKDTRSRIASLSKVQPTFKSKTPFLIVTKKKGFTGYSMDAERGYVFSFCPEGCAPCKNSCAGHDIGKEWEGEGKTQTCTAIGAWVLDDISAFVVESQHEFLLLLKTISHTGFSCYFHNHHYCLKIISLFLIRLKNLAIGL